MKVTGPTDILGLLVRRIGQLGSLRSRTAVAKVIGAEAVTQVALGFREQRDPYQRPWAPTKYRGGQILRDSGRLRSSFSWQNASPDGVRMGSNVKYAATHQYGATIVPKTAKVLRFPIPKGGGKPARVRPGGGRETRFAYAKKVVIPQRMMAPIKSKGIGRTWSMAFNRAAARAVRQLLKK